MLPFATKRSHFSSKLVFGEAGEAIMRIPKMPPDYRTLWSELVNTGEIVNIITESGPLINGKYLHWDKMRHYSPPTGINHREWWLGVKYHRNLLAKRIPLQDKNKDYFSYVFTDPLPEHLHRIDLGAGGLIQMPDQITNPQTKDRYYVGSLIEEAITSSQLEGATTTRPVAKEMLRNARPPRDRSEQMILNNYLTMKRIGELRSEPLTKELVFELHRIVTNNALDDSTAAGRFRRADESIVVGDDYGTIFHDPPLATELPQRMDEMCLFANGQTPNEFMHPIIRSIILHFWLAYDHPFVDGNGRTARALFYWSMLRHGFWLCEFISISTIIIKAPVKYGRAFLYTETDGNDLTYFILYHLEIMNRAVQELHAYIQRKTQQLQQLERQLRGMVLLNHRQRTLIGHALRHPHQIYTIESHRTSHNVVYQTARADLLELANRGLLKMGKAGKAYFFTPVEDLETRLANL